MSSSIDRGGFVFKLLLILAVIVAVGYLVQRYRQYRAATTLALLPRTETSPDGASFRNRLGMEFVRLPAGKFTMGSPQGAADEQPEHEVTFAQPFFMGQYEVTARQWETLMGARPGKNQADDAPIEQVSWNDAQEFMKKLNALDDGYVYRLPSEAEWEYACRAGEDGDYVRDLDGAAWHEKNSYDTTHAVGRKRPNAFGLYDMYGNVWEWCEDHASDDYARAPKDGRPFYDAQTHPDAARVVRGASFAVKPQKIRAALRGNNYARERKDSIGFRLAAAPKG
jgi:formylglycine-generating enzyme required for sulfatase activity